MTVRTFEIGTDNNAVTIVITEDAGEVKCYELASVTSGGDMTQFEAVDATNSMASIKCANVIGSTTASDEEKSIAQSIIDAIAAV